MACECNLAGMFEIEYDGIISANITGSSEFIDIISQCDTGPNVFLDVRKRLKGASTGTLNISAYAFASGATDRFLGASCPSTAGVTLPTQTRFDCENNVTHIILTKTGEAFREGDPITGITLVGEFCSFRTVNADASSGPTARITDTERYLGSDLVWTGVPIAFDTREPGRVRIFIFDLSGRLTCTLIDTDLAEGSHSISLDGSSLGRGVYFLRIETSNGVRTGRFVVLR